MPPVGPRFQYAKVSPPKNLADLPRYLRELLGGFFSRLGYIVKLVWKTGPWILFAMLITILVVFMHRENIMRIYRGQESKIDFAALFSRKKKEENKQQPSDEG